MCTAGNENCELEPEEYVVSFESGVEATGHEGIRHIRVDVYVKIDLGDVLGDEDCHTGMTGLTELSSDFAWTNDTYRVDQLEGIKAVHPEAYFFALGLLQAAQSSGCIFKGNMHEYRPLAPGIKPEIILGGAHPHSEYENK